MEYTEYLLHHKSFQRSLSIICISIAILWGFYHSSPVMILNLGISIVVLMLGTPLLFYWLHTFYNIMHNDFIKIRYMTQHKQPYQIAFITKSIEYACFFMLLVLVLLMLVSGMFYQIDILMSTLKLLFFIILYFILMTFIFATILIYTDHLEFAVGIPLVITFAFAIWSYLNLFFSTFYSENSNINTLILQLFTCICLLFLILCIKEYNTHLKHIKKTKLLFYMIFSIVTYISCNAQYERSMSTVITQNLLFMFPNELATLLAYLVWFLPKVVIVCYGAIEFHKLFSTNFIYFKIRGHTSRWFSFFIKSLFKTMLICMVLQIMIFMINGISFQMADISLWIANYLLCFIVILIYAMAYFIKNDSSLLNVIIFIWMGIDIVVLTVHDTWLMNIFLLQQTTVFSIIGVWIISIIFVIANVMLLKYGRR